MRRFFLGWFIIMVLSLGVVATIGAAQTAAPTGVKGAAAAPALDELEQAWLQNVVLAQQLANTQCQALDSVKQFTTVRNDVTAKVEAKRPGFTMDWTTGKLVAKAAK